MTAYTSKRKYLYPVTNAVIEELFDLLDVPEELRDREDVGKLLSDLTWVNAHAYDQRFAR